MTAHYTGVEQSVHRVLSWPGQEDRADHGKIPTLIWYDTDKRVRLAQILRQHRFDCTDSQLGRVFWSRSAISPS
jgi:hypothetical protein